MLAAGWFRATEGDGCHTRKGLLRFTGPRPVKPRFRGNARWPVWHPSDMLVLSAADVERLFTLNVAIESQRAAFTALGRGTAVLPPRLLVPGAGESVAFCYAARLSPGGAAVSKFGSVNPANSARGLPSVTALVTVLDAETGQPVAVMDGTSVTTIRTSAASAVAASVLARPGARTLAVLGSGVQAKAHVTALSAVLDLDEVRIWSHVGAAARGPGRVTDAPGALSGATGPGGSLRRGRGPRGRRGRLLHEQFLARAGRDLAGGGRDGDQHRLVHPGPA